MNPHAEKLRELARTLRVTPLPLAAIIPTLQAAADEIERLTPASPFPEPEPIHVPAKCVQSPTGAHVLANGWWCEHCSAELGPNWEPEP